MAIAFPPLELISSATCLAPSRFKSATTTAAPSLDNLCTEAFPKPLAEPVTKATFPFKLIIVPPKI